MKKLRGMKLGRKLVRVFKWIFRSNKRPARFTSLNDAARSRNPISKILSLARELKRGTRTANLRDPSREYIRLGKVKQAVVPKGHLAVYVGESNGDIRREFVPVIYFNHPLFGELLKGAERVYGYNHPGGIKIPVGYSEFEKVKTRIATWDRCRRCFSNY